LNNLLDIIYPSPLTPDSQTLPILTIKILLQALRKLIINTIVWFGSAHVPCTCK